jgi:hypothetical protein
MFGQLIRTEAEITLERAEGELQRVALMNRRFQDWEAFANIFVAAPAMFAACEALLRDSEARPGAYIHVRGLDELRAAVEQARPQHEKTGK